MASIQKYPAKKGPKGYLWRVQYPGPDGVRRTKQGFRTKDEAQAWAEHNAVSARVGEWIKPEDQRVTLTEVWDRWKVAKERRVKTSSWRSLDSAWRTHVEPAWGLRTVASVHPAEVQDWVNQLDRAPSTVERAYHLLSTLFDEAVRLRQLRTNPCQGVQTPSRKKSKDVTLTQEQVRLLIEQTTRYQSLVAFLAYTGVRWGEAAALTVADIDLKKQRAIITKSASTVGGKVTEGDTKTSTSRSVAIPTPATPHLNKAMKDKLPTALLWTNQAGKHVTTPSRRSWWHSAVDACKNIDDSFPDVTPHDLRHAAASMMISAGANALVVQRQLGHSSAKMTLDKYSHLFDSDLDDIIDAFPQDRGIVV
ncbi:site-specific integrase [Corynebacterium sanguinis]|nr:tyrosine-type recombinase/integrase [Corynebacterium sanguinis]MCT1883217.1 site-specific integrase [Corynebacterium sanguinis]TVS22065.1 site-specific integrase [Corynebacterium sanguinis]TVS23761.1 site-specific integrase [Corynebacterium sanguinis]